MKYILETYQPETVLTAIKPPLEGVHYRRYIEINLFSIVEIARLASGIEGISNFIYVSSIAASNHYTEHHYSNETEVAIPYTLFEAPYDVSKRFAEDYILGLNNPNFRTISIRTSGIFGGDTDPYMYLRYPIILVVPDLPIIDFNYAGNIAEALYSTYKYLQEDVDIGGSYYYYTGSHISQKEVAMMVSKATNKPTITIHMETLRWVLSVWKYLIIDTHQYSKYDILRMGTIEQTFNQTKFHQTFKNFSEPYKVDEFMETLYSN